MNKEWLEHHHNQGLSQRQIAQLANVSAATIRSWFKKYSIKPRSISDALKINPSKSIWDDERRDKLSKKMIEVQSHRADELSKKCLIRKPRRRWLMRPWRQQEISWLKSSGMPCRKEVAKERVHRFLIRNDRWVGAGGVAGDGEKKLPTSLIGQPIS